MAALERYAAEHAEATSYTVQLHHGRDHVLAAGGHPGNAEVVAALRALRGLPDLYAVDIGIDPYPAHATAVLTTGSDLVAAADTLAHAVPSSRMTCSPTWRSAGLTIRGEGLPHTLTVHSGVAPSAMAAQAFAVATRLEERSPVQLVVQPPAAGGTCDELIRLDEHSSHSRHDPGCCQRAGLRDAAALRAGAGRTVPRPRASFDTAAWRKAALPVVEALPGVRAATLSDPNSGAGRPPTCASTAGWTPQPLRRRAGVRRASWRCTPSGGAGLRARGGPARTPRRLPRRADGRSTLATPAPRSLSQVSGLPRGARRGHRR